MNKIEEIVYHALYKHPALKLFVRNVYQGIFDMMPRKANFISGKSRIKEGYFFGFHDVCPFDSKETKVLANKLSFDLRMPKKGDSIKVGYFEFNNGVLGDFKELSTSTAWNYHKGCRLQWIDDNQIIFNTALNDKLVAKIIDVNNGEERIVNRPIDTVYNSDNECIAATFSYGRLQLCMPGYHYPYDDESYKNVKYPSETGLFLVDLNSNKTELLVNLDYLAKNFCDDNPDLYYHYVTHTEFSKDGRYISFLYRRMIDGGDINRRITKILVYDRELKKVIELPTQVSGSHYVWNNKNQIIASCIINNKSCHVLYDMNNINNYKLISPSILNQDGHQTFINDSVFITDTYPDKWRQCQLYIADINENSVKKILSVNSPKKFMSKTVYNYTDCDLHPRVSPSGKYVCCDTVHTGFRSLFVMKI